MTSPGFTLVLKRILKPHNMSDANGPFQITLYPDSYDTISKISNSLKGFIGKTVTELTILSLGYTKMISKFSGDKGLDGSQSKTLSSSQSQNARARVQVPKQP